MRSKTKSVSGGKNKGKTKEHLVKELQKLHKQMKIYDKAITERRKVKDALKETKDYTENIIKSMVDTLIVTDSEG